VSGGEAWDAPAIVAVAGRQGTRWKSRQPQEAGEGAGEGESGQGSILELIFIGGEEKWEREKEDDG
jgi:hypothetical protein